MKPVVKIGFFSGKPDVMPESRPQPKVVLKSKLYVPPPRPVRPPPQPPAPKPPKPPKPPKRKRLWDNYIEVGNVRKNDKRKMTIYASTKNGVRYVCVREYYLHSSGTWRPMWEGLTLPLVLPINKGTERVSICEPTITKILEALEIACNMDLYDENNAVYKGDYT